MNYQKLKSYLSSPPAIKINPVTLNLSDNNCDLPFEFQSLEAAPLDTELMDFFNRNSQYVKDIHRITIEFIGPRFRYRRPWWYDPSLFDIQDLAFIICEHVGDIPILNIQQPNTAKEIEEGIKLWWAFVRYRMAFIW